MIFHLIESERAPGILELRRDMPSAAVNQQAGAADLLRLFALDHWTDRRPKLACHWSRGPDGRLACFWEPDFGSLARR